MPTFSSDQTNGALSLIRDGLRLSAGHTLLLLYQDNLHDAAECIKETGKSIGVHVDARAFSREDFQRQYPESFSAERLSREAPVPAGIALIIEWSESTTRARLRFIRQLEGTGEPWRIASMPGVDLNGLASCRSDFVDIREKCLDLFAALARGRLATLSTRRPDGKKDDLRIPIGRFCPIMSTGEIGEGSWGNFPSGETFILPNASKANGWVTLRGSFPNHVLKNADWIRFEVRDGRMRSQSLQASSPALIDTFATYFFSRTGRPKSKNSNSLAELGIGANASIASLSGKPIFDEKKLGTAHIAFGGNHQFNGPLEASIHHDLTCTEADLLVDGVSILSEGVYVLKKEQARPQLSASLTMQTPPLRGRLSLGGTAFRFRALPEPSLEVEYAPYRGASVSIPIANGKIAYIANQLLEIVGNGEPATASSISQQLNSDLSPKSLHNLVTAMARYRLIKVSR